MLPLVDYYELYPNEIPYGIFKLLPKVCQYCDSLIITTEELTTLKCSNSKCPMHMAHKADKMFKTLGIKDMGSSVAFSLIKENNLDSHLKILSLTNQQMPRNNSPEVREKIFNRLQVGRRQKLGVVLDIAQVPGIGDKTSELITAGYSSFKEFFESFSNGRELAFHIQNSLNLKNLTDNTKIRAYHLLQHKYDLLQMDELFEIIKSGKDKLHVVMTDTITSVVSNSFNLSNRKNYIKLLNDKYEGIVTFIDNGSSLSSADVLLTDSTKLTNKRKNALTHRVPILTFADFADNIKGVYGEGKVGVDLRRLY